MDQNVLVELSAMGIKHASAKHQPIKLSSGIIELDGFLEGGLPCGSVVEWGAPTGQGGRELLLAWMAEVTKASWALWVTGQTELVVYPPAWLARGVTLERMRFVHSTSPLAELRPVFMDPLFRVIVLDAPHHFTKEDCAFVARQARTRQQTVVLLRDTILKVGHGNAWTKLRLNSWYEPACQKYCLQVMRGLSPRKLMLHEVALWGLQCFERGAYK